MYRVFIIIVLLFLILHIDFNILLECMQASHIEQVAKDSANGTGGHHSLTITQETLPSSHAGTMSAAIDTLNYQASNNSPEFASTPLTSNDLYQEKETAHAALHEQINKYDEDFFKDNPNPLHEPKR